MVSEAAMPGSMYGMYIGIGTVILILVIILIIALLRRT